MKIHTDLMMLSAREWRPRDVGRPSQEGEKMVTWFRSRVSLAREESQEDL